MLRIGSSHAPTLPSSTPPPSGPAGAGPAGPTPELLAAISRMAQEHGAGAPPPPQDDPMGDPTALPSKGPSPRTPKFDAEKVGQDVARYLGPESRCKSCSFYNQDDSTCHVVSDQVDPEGVCSLFTGSGAGPDDKSVDEPPTDDSAPDEGAPDVPKVQE